MNFIRRLLSLSIIAVIMQIGGECYCDDTAANRTLRRMDGTLTAVDTFEHSFAVQWQNQDMIHYNLTTFRTPEGMTFHKGTDMVDIFDLNIGDPVTIEYYVDPSGNPQVVRMDVGQ